MNRLVQVRVLYYLYLLKAPDLLYIHLLAQISGIQASGYIQIGQEYRDTKIIYTSELGRRVSYYHWQ